MRSRTDSRLLGRCPRCWVREPWCVCQHIVATDSRLDVLIVRHPRETWRASGTARIAELALTRCRVVEARPETPETQQALSDLSATWLLLPGGVPSVAPPPAKRLVVLDGTWREVRRMHRRLPAVWDLPRLSLPAKTETPVRLRRSAVDAHRSTLEAIADAMALLEGEEVAAPLIALHARFVEQSLRSRGAWSYRGGP